MKVSLAWLKELVDLKVDYEELLNRINTQLGEIEAVEDLSLKYKEALIVAVKKVQPLEGSHKLRKCLIDDGQANKDVQRTSQGLIEIVCGALNVYEGMLACWLPPKAVVPATYQTDKPFELSEKKILGQMSCGMLASLAELDLGVDDEGILDLTMKTAQWSQGETQPLGPDLIGKSFAKTFALDTQIIDIENKMFTHRPDCFGLLGVAREIAAITDSPFSEPSWYRPSSAVKTPVKKADPSLEVFVDCPELAACFRAYLLNDLRVAPSPLDLQFKLASVDLKPINNIVDITNYMMYLSGQPTHSFDYDKLLQCSQNPQKMAKLGVRLSREGESLTLLNGKKLVFDEPALVIATDKQPVALAGIMGGAETEVDAQTRRVVLECANFNMYNLWRTTMHYGVFSEAATRFTKGQSWRQLAAVGDQTSQLLCDIAGQPTKLESAYEVLSVPRDLPEPVIVTPAFINERLGSNLSAQKIIELLERVNFDIKLKSADNIEIQPPFYRTDIEIAEDIVEEVGRLNGGYQSLEPKLPQRSAAAIAVEPLLDFKAKIRRCLASAGANEVLNYSFTSQKVLERFGQDLEKSFSLSKPLSPEIAFYRQSLTPSLVGSAESNLAYGHRRFALFEIGCGHQKDKEFFDPDGLPLDLPRCALLCVDQSAQPSTNFYLARRYLDLLANFCRLEFDYEPLSVLPKGLDQPLAAPYDLRYSAVVRVDGQVLGIMGLLKNDGFAAAEIKTDVLLQAYLTSAERRGYQPLSRYPSSVQDLTLQVERVVSYEDLRQTLKQKLATYKKAGWQIHWSLKSIFEPAQEMKNLSFRLTFHHLRQTPDKAEVLAIVAEIVAEMKQKHQAQQVL